MVRLVCRDWKRVLDGWSPYWANLLGIAPNEKVWDYLLQKAKSSPIAISINYSVSFRLQAAAVSRAARIFVAGNVLLDSWAATISAIPDLTELQTLHLMRSEGTNSGRNAMKILGSRLQNLSLGRPATVVAPSLRALRLTRLRSDMLSCLAGILDSSLRLREICIHDDTCSQSNLWATVFEMIQGSAIESLSVQLSPYIKFLVPAASVMPSLKMLHAHVFTPVSAPSLEYLHTNLSMEDLVQTLRQNGNILALVVESCMLEAEPFIETDITLPRCTKIDVLTPLNNGVVHLLSHIHAPMLEDVILRLPVATDVTLHPPPGVSQTEDSSSCYLREAAYSAKWQACRILDALSPLLRNIFSGVVALVIEVAFDHPSGEFTVKLCAKDCRMQDMECAGLCLLVNVPKTRCPCKHRHVNMVSVTHVLRLFAWPCVKYLEVTYSIHQEQHCGDEALCYPDPLSACLYEDRKELQQNLAHMEDLESLKITVTCTMLIGGIQILRILGRDGHRKLCAQLNTIHLVADLSLKGGYPSRAQLWYDVREFAEIRRCMKSDVFPSRVRIILEGDFPFSDEDLDVQHHIRQIADVVEISGL